MSLTALQNAIAQFRDFSDWWTAEIQATCQSAKPLRRFGRSRSFQPSIDASETDNSSPKLADWNAEGRQLVYFGRSVVLPVSTMRLPYRRSQEVANTAVLGKTPFDADSVVAVLFQDESPHMSALIIKKESLRVFLNERRAARKAPEGLGVNRDGLTVWLPRRSLETIHPIFGHLRRRRQWLATAFAVLLIAIAATYTNLYLRYSAAEERLTATVEAQRDEALKVRKLLDQQQKSLAVVEAARTGKDQAVPLVRIWEEVTHTIPDDAWITDLSFDGDTMTLTGYAARSAGLIGAVASSPIFKDPSFVSPVVRVPGQSGERFELRAKVSQP